VHERGEIANLTKGDFSADQFDKLLGEDSERAKMKREK